MDKTTRDFLIGAVFGYLMRHFFPPKEASLWQRIVAGVILIIALYVLYLRYKPNKSDNKKKGAN